MIPISKPWLGEEEQKAVSEVLASGILAQGPRVKELEDKFAAYCGVKHAIATTSGTTALWIALLAHGIGKGDEVITSPFTFIASANSILFAGARPVFADIDPTTYNLDAADVERKVTQRTKAIMPIHLFGYPANMGALMTIAREHNLAMIEDACQAHGASINGKRVGSFGTGCFSLYATKNMMTGEGGMITTDDDQIADKSRLLRAHGMRVRYYHESLGYNFRLTDLQAAIGIPQLAKLDRFNEMRLANAVYFNANLKNVTIPKVEPGYQHVFHQYTIRIRNNRDEATRKLTEAGVGTGIFYPVPVHQQKVYTDLGYHVSLPHSEQAAQQVLSLPVHPLLSHQDREAIVKAVNAL